jgi:hypothetical protein
MPGLFGSKKKETIPEVALPRQVFVFDINNSEGIEENSLFAEVRNRFGLTENETVTHISGTQYLGSPAKARAAADFASYSLQAAEYLLNHLQTT